MIKLDQPLHDIERALMATSDFMTRKQLLEYKPLKIALDKAQYLIEPALFGDNVNYTELRTYPSRASVKLSHPIVLMENHKIANKYSKVVDDQGTELYARRMELVKSLNQMKMQVGEKALSDVWLPDMDHPLDIHTLCTEDFEMIYKIKEENLDEDVARQPEPGQAPKRTKLDTKLAKNRPLKKRPCSSLDKPTSSKKRAARMQPFR